MNTYKICICGDANTGKTQFVHRLVSGGFDEQYIPTLGVEVHPLKLHTNYGDFSLVLWDIAGDPRYSGLGREYFSNVNGAIIMGEDPNPKWRRMILDKSTECPIIEIINKYDDLFGCAISDDDVSSTLEGYLVSPMRVSNLGGYRLELPLLCLLREILQIPDIVLTKKSIIEPKPKWDIPIGK
jgi:GTP-binding nuclear protein Ran